MRLLLTAVSLSLLATPLLHSQQVMSDYLDVFTVKVRPEKRADFDTVNRKIAEANRKAKGDQWTAMTVEYGEGNTVQFVSQRQNFAGIESGMTAFMSAINAGYGPGGLSKMMADFNSTILSSRAEIRRRRWDLTANPPTDAASYNQIIGSARWLRTIRVNVRNGHEDDFEQRAKEAKAALEKDPYVVNNRRVYGTLATKFRQLLASVRSNRVLALDAIQNRKDGRQEEAARHVHLVLRVAHDQPDVAVGQALGLATTLTLLTPQRIPYLLMGATAAIAVGAWLDTHSTNVTRPHQLILSQALIGYGTMLFIGPALAYGFLRMLERGPGHLVTFIVLFSTTQNIGGLAGSALLGSYQVISTRAHALALAERVLPSDPQAFAQLQNGGTALRAALAREASILAFNDVFRLVMAIALLTLGYLVYIRTYNIIRQRRGVAQATT